MIKYAREKLGGKKIATGHYARIHHNSETGRYELLRAFDRNKDQSYFLYDLSQDLLEVSIFPLGEILKSDTRRLAHEYGLKTADKPESQDLCLVESNGSMRVFLNKYLAPAPGNIVDTEGKVLGKHDGVQYYTVGQRKGLGIAAPKPLYVIALDTVNNRVIVGDRTKATQTECVVSRVNWVSIAEPLRSIRAEVHIRYRSALIPVTIIPLHGLRARVVFDTPQFSIVPGQAIVWYEDNKVLGGGIIEKFSQPFGLEKV
jgi:tRNA-specific 2-thiouridylase